MDFSMRGFWPILIGSLVLVAPVSATSLLTNGSFESGLTGWTTYRANASDPTGGCATPWIVGTAGSATGCNTVYNPIDGTHALYTSFDGYGSGLPSYAPAYPTAEHYMVSQAFGIPTGILSASMSWSDTYQIGVSTVYAPGSYPVVLPRDFRIVLADANGSALTTLFDRQYNPVSSAPPLTPWSTHTIDLTGALQTYGGQSAQLQFWADVPQYFTGAAGFGLDSISLNAQQAPEPGTCSLLAGALVAMLGIRRRFLR